MVIIAHIVQEDGVNLYYPYQLNIYLTEGCNLNCNYCFVKREVSKSTALSTSALKKAIAHFLNFPGDIKTIGFTGGEPLLNFEELKEVCFYIQKKTKPNNRLNINIVTNGTLLDNQILSFLRNNRIDLKISIDGQKKIHDFNRPFKLRKYGSSYERIVGNLKKFHKDKKYKVSASLVFTPATVRDLVGNIKFLWKIGFDYIDFYPHLYAQWSKEELKKTEEVFRQFVEFYLSIFNNTKETKVIFRNSLLHSFIEETGLYKPMLCQKIHLDWNGNFYYCDKVFSLPEPDRRKFVIGNICKGVNNRLRLELLERNREAIDKITGKDCIDCKYLKYCFCPIGHYIYFSFQGLNFKEYFPQFCRISLLYIRSFLEIKKYLKFNPSFINLYSN